MKQFKGTDAEFKNALIELVDSVEALVGFDMNDKESIRSKNNKVSLMIKAMQKAGGFMCGDDTPYIKDGVTYKTLEYILVVNDAKFSFCAKDGVIAFVNVDTLKDAIAQLN